MQKIDIILETDDYLVLNKPAGISVHGDGKFSTYTVADFIFENYPKLSDVGEELEFYGNKIKRPGIVHRLDKDTTGCLVVAKNQETYENLKKQFQDHKTEKIYHAFVYGSLKENRIIVDSSIGRSKGNIRKWTVGKNARGNIREAKTTFNVIKRIGIFEEKGSTEKGVYCFLECIPFTGRTHQIRVHLKSINHPIVCDSLYAENRESALGFKRLALHAYSLSFFNRNSEKVTCIAEYPEDFKNAVAIR
jgi:23S rRNA pseudouridine1911/1915/1917 synthase